MTNKEKKRCMCKTEEGKRCHNKADLPSIYCYLHKHCKHNQRIHHSKHKSNHQGYNIHRLSSHQGTQRSSSPIFASPSFGTESGAPSAVTYSPLELGRYLSRSDLSLNESPAEGEGRMTPLNFPQGSLQLSPEYPPGLENGDLEPPEILVPSSEELIRRRELENSLSSVQLQFNEERQNPLAAQELVRKVVGRLLFLSQPSRPTEVRKFRFQPSLLYLGPLGKVDALKNRLSQVGTLRKIILQTAFKSSSTSLGLFGRVPFGSSSTQSQVEVLDDPIKLFLFRNLPNLSERQRFDIRKDVLEFIQSSEAYQAGINIEAILNNLVIPAQLRNGDVDTVLVAEQLALENLENNDEKQQQNKEEDLDVVAAEKSRVGLVLRLAIIFIANLIIFLFSKKQEEETL